MPELRIPAAGPSQQTPGSRRDAGVCRFRRILVLLANACCLLRSITEEAERRVLGVPVIG